VLPFTFHPSNAIYLFGVLYTSGGLLAIFDVTLFEQVSRSQ
jgi:hypothetical protein